MHHSLILWAAIGKLHGVKCRLKEYLWAQEAFKRNKNGQRLHLLLLAIQKENKGNLE